MASRLSWAHDWPLVFPRLSHCARVCVFVGFKKIQSVCVDWHTCKPIQQEITLSLIPSEPVVWVGYLEESILVYLNDHGGRRRAVRGCVRVVRGDWQVSISRTGLSFTHTGTTQLQ